MDAAWLDRLILLIVPFLTGAALIWALWRSVSALSCAPDGEQQATPAAAAGSRQIRQSGLILLLVIITVLAVTRTPFEAENYEIAPDPTEYAAGARSLAESSGYYLRLGEQNLPQRYAPWFSWLFLMPAFLLLGTSSIGYAVFPVTAAGVLAVVMAALIGKKLAGPWATALCGLAVISCGSFRYLSGSIMTDVPVALFYLAGWLLFIGSAQKQRPDPGTWTPAGILAAYGAAFKPTAAAILVPFLLAALHNGAWRDRLSAALRLLAPLALVTAASLVYNRLVFGSALRTGYNFWSPVPYDIPHLTLSLSYLAANMRELLDKTGILIFLLATAVLPVFCRSASLARSAEKGGRPADLLWKASAIYILGSGLPTLAFYSVYFFQSYRFFLPVEIMLGVCAGALLGRLMQILRVPLRSALSVLLALSVVLGALRVGRGPKLVERRESVARLLMLTPVDAIIVSGFDPVYLGTIAGNESRRNFIPVSERVEYASKHIAWSRIELPPEKTSDIKTAYSLLPSQPAVRRAVGLTALESPQILLQWCRQGRAVFLETSLLTKAEVRQLRNAFSFEEIHSKLYRLRTSAGHDVNSRAN